VIVTLWVAFMFTLPIAVSRTRPEVPKTFAANPSNASEVAPTVIAVAGVLPLSKISGSDPTARPLFSRKEFTFRWI
jgi:hypothetical protein